MNPWARGDRLVGYLNRRPYLWFVDCDSKEIEPAAELRTISQGIDEVVVMAPER